jgi:hypothetical protein
MTARTHEVRTTDRQVGMADCCEIKVSRYARRVAPTRIVMPVMFFGVASESCVALRQDRARYTFLHRIRAI